MAGVKTDEGRAQRVKVFEVIVRHWYVNGLPPSTKHLTDALDMPYTTLLWHLRSLREQGIIKFEDGRIGRTLRTVRRKKAEDIT